MARHVPVVVALASYLGVAAPAWAQTVIRTSTSAKVTALAEGVVHGVVRDDRGDAVGGASIVALGSAIWSVRSDTQGKFAMALAPGDYVLRATRDGYVSTYRESVRVRSSASVERVITLVRQGALAAATAAGTDDHAHSEAAWRLRHLTRSVLRDTATPGTTGATPTAGDKEFTPRLSFFDRAVEGSARAAASFFTQTDFSGQLNFVTTSTAPAGRGWWPFGGPRGVAYVAVGAPMGAHGDWRIRGTIATGGVSSWAVLAEYQASPERPHAFNVGFSYSAQAYASQGAQPIGQRDARSVGGVYAFDVWRLGPRVTLDYGVRLDRYDYTASNNLFSPRGGVRVNVLPRVYFRTSAAQRLLAPGADEFLPPASAGLWLPPERTFSSLVPGLPFRVEDVRHVEAAVEREFGAPHRRHTVSIVRFWEESLNQLATLFRSHTANATGHYQVASPGSVQLDGWIVRLDGRWGRRVSARIDYTAARGHWTIGPHRRLLAYRTPSLVRPAHESLHDVTLSVDTYVPESSTRITVGYRFDTAFSQVRWKGSRAASGRRFAVQVHQALPYQPIEDGRLEAVFSVRTLFRDGGDDVRPFYDELLTVAPPLRLMGGVQVKF